MPNEPSGSFVRWQAITIGQLSYAINLILGFSVATLGFQLSLLQNKEFGLPAWGKCVFLLSLISLIISAAFGVWVVINRLRDFRLTTRISDKRESMIEAKKTKEEIDNALEPYRMKSRELGEMTWGLFWWQIGSFSVSIFLVTLTVLAAFGQKLA